MPIILQAKACLIIEITWIRMLLNAAKCQGYSFYSFWVIKGKPAGGVKLLPPPSPPPRLGLRATSSWVINNYLKPTGSPACRFYGHPKIQKLGIPIRSIVSYSGSLFYKLNKYIATILTGNAKVENSNVKSSTTFSSYTGNVPIKHDKIIYHLTSFPRTQSIL